MGCATISPARVGDAHSETRLRVGDERMRDSAASGNVGVANAQQRRQQSSSRDSDVARRDGVTHLRQMAADVCARAAGHIVAER